MARTITVELVVPRNAGRYLAALVLSLIFVPDLGSETVSLSTYYPAPSGVYSSLLTTGQTTLARSGGAEKVRIGSSADPAKMLDIAGSMKATSTEAVEYVTRFNTGCIVKTAVANGTTSCNAGQFATLIRGVYAKQMSGPDRYDPSQACSGVGCTPGTQPLPSFLCCSYPSGSSQF